MFTYIVVSFINSSDKYQMSYKEADTQVDMDEVTHSPQSSRIINGRKKERQMSDK